MSDIAITIQEIQEIDPHPNADRLEIAKILGTQVVVPKDTHRPGEKVAYFPPDMLLPPDVSARLGVQQYLKHALWEGEKTQCRVAACRLRGVPSYGFVVNIDGWDVTQLYGAKKYEPPEIPGDSIPEHPLFHRYTSIQHYWRYPEAIPEGTPVRITEKIHGTNSRIGLIDGEWVAGSHRIQLKQHDARGRVCRYWKPLEDDQLRDLIRMLSAGGEPVVVFGEIFGPGIQDMDYGGLGYRIFDISIGGEYLDWAELVDECQEIPTVPLFYEGPFSPDLVEEYTHGPTTVTTTGQIRCKFKGREGIVITPLQEQWSDVLQGRMILKSVSADYLDRKGATDNG